MYISIFVFIISFTFPGGLQGEEIVFKGSAKWLIANNNTVHNIESEIAAFKCRRDFPQGDLLKFASPKIVLDLDGASTQANTIPVMSETVFYKFRAETSGETIGTKMMILTAYITLRFNGMTAFNSGRVVFEMAKDWEKLRPEDTVQFPLSLLERISDIPDWIKKHYLNKDSDLGKGERSYDIYRLLDDDIIWLFLDNKGKAELICGYDGRHRNLAGFQEVFDNVIARRKVSGTLNKVESERISDDMWKDFQLRWLSPLEITSIFE